MIATILSWRPDNGHNLWNVLSDDQGDISGTVSALTNKIFGRRSPQIIDIIQNIKRSDPGGYGAYHSTSHLFKVTICLVALKNYLREEITKEDIVAALLHDYKYNTAVSRSLRYGITVEETSMNLAFQDDLFENYPQFMTVRDLVMETVPHKTFKIVRHPLQVADLMASYGLCIGAARSESEKIVEEFGISVSPKECFDSYGKTFCFGMNDLNEQKIILHKSSFD